MISSDNHIHITFPPHFLSLPSLTPPPPPHTHTVTAIATTRKELRRIRSPRWLRNYRFRVNKVFKGNLPQTSSSKRSLRVVIADTNDESTAAHLQADTKYILNGRMVDDVMYISGPQYIHHYSREIESHIQSC